MRGEQRGEIDERRFGVLAGVVVETFDDDERLDRGRAGGALGALAPAPASGGHDVVLVHEDDFAGVWVDALGGSEVCEGLGAGGEADGD